MEAHEDNREFVSRFNGKVKTIYFRGLIKAPGFISILQQRA
jgi:hypothetical protein